MESTMKDEYTAIKPEHGRLRFRSSVTKVNSQESTSPYVVVPREPWESHAAELLSDVWERWGMDRRDPPKLIISVTGGAVAFDVNQRLIDDLKLCLIKVATTKGINAWIITGGTYTGITKLVGDAYGELYNLQRSSGIQPVVLGIAMYDYVRDKEMLTEPVKRPDRTVNYEYKCKQDEFLLDPHHTHFILVEDRELSRRKLHGGEIKLRADFTTALMRKSAIRKLADNSDSNALVEFEPPIPNSDVQSPMRGATASSQDVSVVTLVLEGGPGTVKTALEAIRAGTPIIVFAGSGRAANLFVKIYDRVRAGTPSEKEHFIHLKPLAKTLYPDKVLKDVNNRDTNVEDEVLEDICEMTAKGNWHLVNIYRYSGQRHNDIDEAILKAILRALKKPSRRLNFEVWKQCFELAVAWNLCNIARSKLLNNYNRSHVKSLDSSLMDELLLDVLVGNKHKFAQLFMDLGVDLTAFLQNNSLSSLYEKTLNERETNNINIHLVQINGIRKSNQITPKLAGCDPEESSEGFNYTAVLNELTANLYMPEAEESPDEDLAALDPHRELFVWSVLFHRMEMARMFLKKCPQPICAALFANKLLMSLAKQAAKSKEFHLCKELASNAKEYEAMAVSVLDICYSRNPENTKILMERNLAHWGQRTLLSTANLCKQMDFIASDCCQLHIDDLWWGQIAKGTHHFKIMIACILPVLVMHSRFIDIQKKPPNEEILEDAECQRRPSEKRQKIELENDTIWRLRHFFSAPVTKFCYHSASYLVLLGLYSYFLMLDLHPNRFPNVAEVLVLVWTIALLLELIRQCVTLEKQPKRPLKVRINFSDIWNRFRLLMYVMTIVGFILARCLKNDVDYEHARNVYCIAIIMYYLCVLQLYFVHKELGPKVVIVLHMMKDIVIFLFLLVVFVFAFGVVSQALMYPNSEPSWRILFNVLHVPYYTLYEHLIPFTTLMGQAEMCSDDYSVYSKDFNRPQCSQFSWLVNVIYAVYVLLVIVMLLNILIAIFTNTFKAIQEQNERTWCFYRYRITTEYQKKSVLAPPLLLLSQAYWLYCWLRGRSLHQPEEATSKTLNEELATFESSGVHIHFSDVLSNTRYGRKEVIDTELKQLESRLSKKWKRKNYEKTKHSSRRRRQKKADDMTDEDDHHPTTTDREYNQPTSVFGHSRTSLDRLISYDIA